MQKVLSFLFFCFSILLSLLLIIAILLIICFHSVLFLIKKIWMFFIPKKIQNSVENFFEFLGEENLPYVEAKNFNNDNIEEIPETTS